MFADDYTKGPVPHSFQHNWYWLANVIIGIAICLPVFVYGGEIARQLSFGPMMVALVLGGVLTGILMGTTTGIGAVTRLSTTLLAQKVFGTMGGIAVMAAAVITSLGWWGVQTEIMVDVFINILKTTYDIELEKPLVALVGGFLMITTTVFGAKAIGKLSILTVPLLFAMLVAPVFLIPGGVDLQKIIHHTATPPGSIGLVVGGMLGSWMAGVVILPDFGRFTSGFKTAFTGSLVACLVGMTGLMGLSACLSILLGVPNFMIALPTLGLGTLALIVVVLATWGGNDANLYVAVLPIASRTKRFSRAFISLVLGAIATLLCAVGVFQNFVAWLVLIGVALGPIAACYIVTFFMNRPRLNWETPAPAFRRTPLLAWGVGSVVGLMTTPQAGFGFEFFTLTTVPPLDALLVTALIMVVAHKIRKI